MSLSQDFLIIMFELAANLKPTSSLSFFPPPQHLAFLSIIDLHKLPSNPWGGQHSKNIPPSLNGAKNRRSDRGGLRVTRGHLWPRIHPSNCPVRPASLSSRSSSRSSSWPAPVYPPHHGILISPESLTQASLFCCRFWFTYDCMLLSLQPICHAECNCMM